MTTHPASVRICPACRESVPVGEMHHCLAFAQKRAAQKPQDESCPSYTTPALAREVGKRLAIARQAAGMTLAGTAAACGKNAEWGAELLAIERGQCRSVGLSQIFQLCAVYEVFPVLIVIGLQSGWGEAKNSEAMERALKAQK